MPWLPIRIYRFPEPALMLQRSRAKSARKRSRNDLSQDDFGEADRLAPLSRGGARIVPALRPRAERYRYSPRRNRAYRAPLGREQGRRLIESPDKAEDAPLRRRVGPKAGPDPFPVVARKRVDVGVKLCDKLPCVRST